MNNKKNKELNTVINSKNKYEEENKKINDFINENPKEAIEWLNKNASRRWGNSGQGYDVEFQKCQLGGYCAKGSKCEEKENPRKWKDYDDTKSENEYFDELCKQQGRTQKVDCECEWVKKGEKRAITYREKGRKNWDTDCYRWYCEEHAKRRVEKIKAKTSISKWKGGIELRNEPMWAENWTILQEKQAQIEQKKL